MERHADNALTAVSVSLMLFATVQLGFNNDAHAGEGGLSVTAAGKTVVLPQAGYGTIIESGQPPAEPFELTGDQVQTILSLLAPAPSHPTEPAPSVAEVIPSLDGVSLDGMLALVDDDFAAMRQPRANSARKRQKNTFTTMDR